MTEKQITKEEARRARVLAGARTVFIEKGFNGATTDAIAAAAKTSKQTLYALFPSKEMMILAVLEQALAAPRAFVVPRLRSLRDLEETLLQFAAGLLDDVARPDTVALLRVVIGEVYRHDELRRAVRNILPLRFLESVKCAITAAHRAGLVTAPQPELPARMFVGSVLSYVMIDAVLADGPPVRPDDETLRTLVRLFLETVKP